MPQKSVVGWLQTAQKIVLHSLGEGFSFRSMMDGARHIEVYHQYQFKITTCMCTTCMSIEKFL